MARDTLNLIVAAQAASLARQIAEARNDAELAEIAARLGRIDELLTPEYVA
jgi:hypothetical protein